MATESKRDQQRALDAEPALTEQEKSEMKLARPKRRSDCVDGPRPCPWVGCRYHLFMDTTGAGSLKMLRSIDDLETAPATCALDVADAGGKALEEVGDLIGVTRERVRQIEQTGLKALIDWAEKAKGE